MLAGIVGAVGDEAGTAHRSQAGVPLKWRLVEHGPVDHFGVVTQGPRRRPLDQALRRREGGDLVSVCCGELWRVAASCIIRRLNSDSINASLQFPTNLGARSVL